MRRNVSVPWLGGAAALSFGIGAATAMALMSEARSGSGGLPGPDASVATCLELPADQVAAGAALAALLANTTVAKELNPRDPASFHEMIDQARADPVSRRELMDRYRSAPPGDAKRMLRSVLMSLHSPDVAAFFIELAASHDPDQQRDGLEILRITGRKTSEVRQVAMQALETQQDARILSEAIGALHAGIAPQSESAAIAQQLRTLAEHADLDVRAQSIRGLVRWDKTGESVPVLEKALADAAPEVRNAAVVGIMENHLRQDELKAALMRIANAPGESAGLRTNAVLALERYALSADEYERILQSAMEADAGMDAELADRP